METYAFISRHVPTKEQVEMAKEKGVKLIPVGDIDAFSVNYEDVQAAALERGLEDFDGVVVVHPAAALRLCMVYPIGVFENANRAPEGERPRFEAKALHLYDVMEALAQRGWF